MSIWSGALPFFDESELNCSCCGLIRLDRRFAASLCGLRQEWGAQLHPTSVCRCPAFNERVDGHPKSMHLTDRNPHQTVATCAADIYWKEWNTGEKLNFARRARKHKFSIGLNETFCHIDRRDLVGLPQTVFTYDNWPTDWFTVEDVTR